MKKQSKLTRISSELDGEIRKFAQKNNMLYTDATRQIAKIINSKRNRSIIIKDEIKF